MNTRSISFVTSDRSTSCCMSCNVLRKPSVTSEVADMRASSELCKSRIVRFAEKLHETQDRTHVWFGPAPLCALPPGEPGPGEPLPLTEANNSSRASRCAEASICRFDVTTACRYSFVQLRSRSSCQREHERYRGLQEANAPVKSLLNLLDVFTARRPFPGPVEVVHLKLELLRSVRASPSAQRTKRASAAGLGDAPQCRACNPPILPSHPPRAPRGR